jgi:peroxiredoxin (alkyl hydroperoxide reductase subunit C)
MLTVGDRLPAFSLKAVVATDPAKAFIRVTEATHADQWLVLFTWPMDFTLLCPTEIAAFGELYGEFAARNTQVLGCSTDSEFVHLAWRADHPALRDLPFPMLADVKRELTGALGVLDREEGVALPATFIVDPRGVIRHVSVNDLDVGRNPHEVLRLLDAQQTGELCPCNWQPGEPTLMVP